MARSIAAGAFRRSDRTIMIAAVVLAAIAAVLVFVAANSGGSSSTAKTVTPAAGTLAVVTALSDISANTTITADMVQVTTLPAAAVLTGAYTGTDGLVGLTTRYPLLAGEQVTPNKVGESVKDDKSLALVVPPGQRAISIPTKEESIVGGLILPGDLVDIIAVFTAQDTGVAKSLTLVQNVEVLAVGQKAEEAIARPIGTPAATGAATGSYGQTPQDAKAQPNASTVTLSVTPAQAQLLALTTQDATLVVTLRARGDNANPDTGETNLAPYQAAADTTTQQ
jgi:pilus assembly protein CpaB